jgi:hypothetical protein
MPQAHPQATPVTSHAPLVPTPQPVSAPFVNGDWNIRNEGSVMPKVPSLSDYTPPTFGFPGTASSSDLNLPALGIGGGAISTVADEVEDFGGIGPGPVSSGYNGGAVGRTVQSQVNPLGIVSSLLGSPGKGGFNLSSIFGGGSPGGTSGFAGPVGGSGSGGFNLGSLFGGGSSSGGGFNLGSLFGGGSGGGGGFNLGSILGGGSKSGGGLGSLLGIGGSGGGFNLGSLFGRGPTPGPAASAQPGWTGTAAPWSDTGGTFDSVGGGDIGDVASSGSGGLGGLFGSTAGVGGAAGAGLGMVGMMLLSHGMGGNNEGTATGAFEDAGGGAMIGLQYGGPLGAAIGAVAGLGIGFGEMLAGMESPAHKAVRYVKGLYGVTISETGAQAQQIVALANSKYGGNIQLTVRSPEVRQMVGLFAQGTNQSTKGVLSGTTPFGGSLITQNGTLYQGQDYSSGQGYAYASALPTLGGNGGVTQLPSPSNYNGGTNGYQTSPNISMNVNGADLASFMTGSYVTPPFVASQFQSSQNSSMGRVYNSAVVQDPGMSVS